MLRVWTRLSGAIRCSMYRRKKLMNDDMSESSEYIHGNSLEEQHRLSLLNDILNESCLRELNLQQREKVLDLGSGLG